MFCLDVKGKEGRGFFPHSAPAPPPKKIFLPIGVLFSASDFPGESISTRLAFLP